MSVLELGRIEGRQLGGVIAGFAATGALALGLNNRIDNAQADAFLPTITAAANPDHCLETILAPQEHTKVRVNGDFGSVAITRRVRSWSFINGVPLAPSAAKTETGPTQTHPPLPQSASDASWPPSNLSERPQVTPPPSLDSLSSSNNEDIAPTDPVVVTHLSQPCYGIVTLRNSLALTSSSGKQTFVQGQTKDVGLAPSTLHDRLRFRLHRACGSGAKLFVRERYRLSYEQNEQVAGALVHRRYLGQISCH